MCIERKGAWIGITRLRTFECDIRANVLYIEGSLRFNVCRHFFNSPVCGDFSCLNGKVPEKIHAVLQNFLGTIF